jgi:hypothetical protein
VAVLIVTPTHSTFPCGVAKAPGAGVSTPYDPDAGLYLH